MIRNTSGQVIGAQMVNSSTGAAYVGTVTCYITIDGGTQTLGSVGSGLCTAEGNGYYTYFPTASETDGALIGYTFIGSGAVPVTIQVAPITASQAAAVNMSTGTGASTTVLALVSLALRRIGVLAEGEIAAPSQAADGMATLNDYIADVLTNDRLAIYSITRTLWTIANGTADYFVGIGGTINTSRPVTMNMQGSSVAFIDTSSSQLATEIPMWMLSDDSYQAIPQKGTSGTYPTSWYYNPTYTGISPYGTLTLWPVPNVSTLQGVFYSPSAVQEFTSLTQIVALPPGYRRFLRDNLAIELSTEYTIEPSTSLINSARESKASVLAVNTRLQDLGIDFALVPFTNKGNIYTGP